MDQETSAAVGAEKIGLDAESTHVIRPAVGADRDVVAAVMIAAIDQNTADAGRAQFAERDLLRVGHCGLYLRTLFLRTAVLD